MPLEHDRIFSGDSPVTRYWLFNCVGYRVEGERGRMGVVAKVCLGQDGVEALAVRRRRPLGRVALIPVRRVASLDPWGETIVLAPRPRRDRGRSSAAAVVGRTRSAAHTLRPVAATAGTRSARALRLAADVAGRWSARALRVAWLVVQCLLVVARRLVLALAVVARPAARVAHLLLRAYVDEARRAWRDERAALAAWHEQRRMRAEGTDADAPLARAMRGDGSDGNDVAEPGSEMGSPSGRARSVRRRRPL